MNPYCTRNKLGRTERKACVNTYHKSACFKGAKRFSHWEINHEKFASRVLYQLPVHYVPEATQTSFLRAALSFYGLSCLVVFNPLNTPSSFSACLRVVCWARVNRPALPPPGASVVVWFGRFPVVVLWCCVCDLLFGGCCLCLPLLFCVFFLFCLGCFGSVPCSVPSLVLPAPSVGLLVPVSFLLTVAFGSSPSRFKQLVATLTSSGGECQLQV